MGTAIQLNARNIDFLLKQPCQAYEWIRFDSNNDCNLHCVYCHNPRSDDRIDLEKLTVFLNSNVDRVENFQFGCVMEPTLDKRMTDIMKLVAGSAARPTGMMMLQTNGVLLHLHDHRAMKEAGLSHLSMSIDSNVTETFRKLRGGANFKKVAQNMHRFRESFPDVVMQFITTVNTANIHELETLIDWGLQLQVTRFVLREMFWDPRSRVVDADKMRRLLLPQGAFNQMRQRIESKYRSQAQFFFSESERLLDYAEDVRESSYPPENRAQHAPCINLRSRA